MKPISQHGLVHEIEEHWLAFALSFLGVFTVLFVALLILDWVPDPFSAWQKEHGGAPVAAVSTGDVSALHEAPVRIVADGIALRADIENPASTSTDVLDEALTRGAVRYPTSALLGQEGTVLLFGHSSYLPIVHNQAYKTFDGIQDLAKGDSVSVYSATHEYRYAVTEVRKANVEDRDTNTIVLEEKGTHLVLVTCNSFASKSDRFVVTADLSGVYAAN